MPTEAKGWWTPQASRKAHYFVAGRALCGKWACLAPHLLEDDNHDSPDNCAACRKKRDALAATEFENGGGGR